MLPLVDLVPPARAVEPWEARNRWTEQRGFKLRTTQHQAIDFIAQRRGTLLADDPRVGKTASSIMTHDPQRGPLIVVAPLSTRAVWLGWLRRIWPEYADQIGVVVGRKFADDVFHKPIVFGHYDVIHAWQAILPRIGTLIFDEAHLLTNPKSRRSNAASILQSRAERVVALTGTPIYRLPDNLWNVLGLVAPGAWGTYWEFCTRYAAPISTAYGTQFTGVSNEVELKERLTEVMLRRRWIDVADDLPPITRSVVVADLTEAERRRLDILAGKLKSERTNTAGNLAAYREQVATIKQRETVRVAQKIMDGQRPVVIWTWHKSAAKSIADDLAGRGYATFLIHGEVSAAERESRMDAWRACPNGALIATLLVAQVGIDLSHASEAIFAELDYTPAVIGQGEMRTFHPSRPMTITFVVANHIVDQRIVRALIAKLGAADPLGVGAAIDSIDALRDAVLGPRDEGDLDRLLEDMLASAA